MAHANVYPSPGRPLNVTDTYTFTGDRKLILITVGLPARGKTYISRKLSRYLSWLGFKTAVINVGDVRRQCYGAHQTSEFFDPENSDGVAARKKSAIIALKDALDFLKKGGQVVIYDGTNSTVERRAAVKQYIESNLTEVSWSIIWIESICDDMAIVEHSIKDTKLTSPDYVGVPAEQAAADFRRRIKNYAKVYVPLKDDTKSYIKVIDTGRQVIANRVQGYIQGKVLLFLANLQIHKKPIFLTRHGESEYNVLGKIGGDSPLSKNGRKYAKALSEFMNQQPEALQGIAIWCSTLRRSLETATNIADLGTPIQWRALSEIEVGTCDGMTYQEVEEKLPDEFKSRKADKLHYRYPRGESYKDLIHRLEPIILALERVSHPVLVIGHRAVIRCLYSYFRDLPTDKIPHLPVPLHQMFKITPKAYGAIEEVIPFGITSVDRTITPHNQADKQQPKGSAAQGGNNGHSNTDRDRNSPTKASF